MARHSQGGNPKETNPEHPEERSLAGVAKGGVEGLGGTTVKTPAKTRPECRRPAQTQRRAQFEAHRRSSCDKSRQKEKADGSGTGRSLVGQSPGFSRVGTKWKAHEAECCNLPEDRRETSRRAATLRTSMERNRRINQDNNTAGACGSEATEQAQDRCRFKCMLM